jgi:hypothetical protein
MAYTYLSRYLFPIVDLQAITDIEDYGNAGTVPSEKLAAAHVVMLEARDKCRISEAEGLRTYGAIDLTVKEVTAT